MSIATNAMVVNLQICAWQGSKLDRSKSTAVTAEAGAEKDAANVNKHLVSRDDLKKLNAAAGALRLHFYSRTLPWKDNGDRLLPRKAYIKFMGEHGALVEVFETEAQDFIDRVYPAARDRAAFRMGDMFKDADYPEPQALREKLYVKLDIDAVTTASDFRVDMDADRLDAIKGSIEQAMTSRLQRAAREPWERVSAALERFIEHLPADRVLQARTVESLAELAETLPALNITSDPEIDKLCERITQLLSGVDLKAVRADGAARSHIKEQADAIMTDLSGFMAATRN
jgi:hypothetical protein